MENESFQPEYYSLLYPFWQAEQSCKISSISFWKVKSHHEKAELLNKELSLRNIPVENLAASIKSVNQINDIYQKVCYLNKIARLYAELDFVLAATSIVKQNLFLINHYLDGLDRADALTGIAGIYLELGFTQKAIDCLNRCFTLAEQEQEDIDSKDITLCEIALVYAEKEDYQSVFDICDLIQDKWDVYCRIIMPIIEKSVYFQEQNLVSEIVSYSEDTCFFEATIYQIAKEYLKYNDWICSIIFIEKIKANLSKANLLIIFAEACINENELEKAIDALYLAENTCQDIQGDTSKNIIFKQINSLLQKIISA